MAAKKKPAPKKTTKSTKRGAPRLAKGKPKKTAAKKKTTTD